MLSENDVKVLKAISEGQSDPQSIADKLKRKVEMARTSADVLEKNLRSWLLSRKEPEDIQISGRQREMLLPSDRDGHISLAESGSEGLSGDSWKNPTNIIFHVFKIRLNEHIGICGHCFGR